MIKAQVFAKERPYWILLTQSIFRGLLPFLLTLGSDLVNRDANPLWFNRYKSVWFWIYFGVNFFINATVYIKSSQFIEIGVIDLVRRDFLMKNLCGMLECNRNSLEDSINATPMINIFDKQSLLSWMDMRIIALDVGMKYYIRIQLYASIHIVVYMIISTLYLLFFFGYGFNYLTQLQWWPFLFEIATFIWHQLFFIQSAARVNMQTDLQIAKVSELSSMITRFLNDWDIIMSL